MAKKTRSKSRTTHYESMADLNKYPNNPSPPSVFKVTVTEKSEGISTLHNIEVAASYKDKGWSELARKGPFVVLEEDGNGALITFRKDKEGKAATEVYLDYGQLHDLKLAVEKFHEINKYGIFRKV